MQVLNKTVAPMHGPDCYLIEQKASKGNRSTLAAVSVVLVC